MPKDKPYIKRKYIELEERDRFTWTARVNGLTSTGFRVIMSRTSDSAGDALLLLTEALEEQGYALR